MPKSIDRVIVHLVFSAKDRFPCIDAAVRPSLHAYLAEVARNAGCACFRVGGTTDHAHLAFFAKHHIEFDERYVWDGRMERAVGP